MVDWAKRNQYGAILVVTLVVGLLLLSAAAFTVGVTTGLLALGASFIVGGHWVTFLNMRGGNRP